MRFWCIGIGKRTRGPKVVSNHVATKTLLSKIHRVISDLLQRLSPQQDIDSLFVLEIVKPIVHTEGEVAVPILRSWTFTEPERMRKAVQGDDSKIWRIGSDW